MYMKLVGCIGREMCKVLSSKSRRWLGPEVSIGQDASIRDVAEWDGRSDETLTLYHLVNCFK
eukprot:scaffold17855_cov72-Skeletonema_marinoi.AAC.1